MSIQLVVARRQLSVFQITWLTDFPQITQKMEMNHDKSINNINKSLPNFDLQIFSRCVIRENRENLQEDLLEVMLKLLKPMVFNWFSEKEVEKPIP